MQTGRLIHALYSVPFASQLMPPSSRGRYSGEESKYLITHRKPIRHPRFFFKNSILIPYSSLKAQLQMVVENTEIEKGVVYAYQTYYSITDELVILITPSKLYIASKICDQPAFNQELSQIFSVQFLKEDSDNPDGKPQPKLDEDDEVLKIVYYDRKLFVSEINRNKDPFSVANKYWKTTLKKVNQKAKKDFLDRIEVEKANNFANFF